LEAIPVIHINDRELLASLLMVQFILPRVLPSGIYVEVTTDSTAARGWFNRLECRLHSDNPQATDDPSRRLVWLELLGEHLFRVKRRVKANWVDSRSNFVADSLTRPDRFSEFPGNLPAVVSSVVQVAVPATWQPAWLLSDVSSSSRR
jgi:hypothetical protein